MNIIFLEEETGSDSIELVITENDIMNRSREDISSKVLCTRSYLLAIIQGRHHHRIFDYQ